MISCGWNWISSSLNLWTDYLLNAANLLLMPSKCTRLILWSHPKCYVFASWQVLWSRRETRGSHQQCAGTGKRTGTLMFVMSEETETRKKLIRQRMCGKWVQIVYSHLKTRLRRFVSNSVYTVLNVTGDFSAALLNLKLINSFFSEEE